MTMFAPIEATTDRVMSALISGLEQEFGAHAGTALADRFLSAEDTDFHWDARIEERWLGAYEASDDSEIELDRVAIIGRLYGAWFVASVIVDGEGEAHGLTAKRRFESRRMARKAYHDGH